MTPNICQSKEGPIITERLQSLEPKVCETSSFYRRQDRPWLTLHLCVWHIVTEVKSEGQSMLSLDIFNSGQFSRFSRIKSAIAIETSTVSGYCQQGAVNWQLFQTLSKPKIVRKCFWHLTNTFWTLKRNIFNSCTLYLVLFGLINRTYTQITLPWSTCPIGADNVTVVECADSSETQYFWFRFKSSLFTNLNFSFFPLKY